MSEVNSLHLIEHPLIKHKVSLMRDIETDTKDFRQLVSEVTLLIGYEATRDLPLETKEIQTPISKTTGYFVPKQVCLVPILRAGLGMVDAMLELLPAAKVGHIGLSRDPLTHLPIEYYCKMPSDLANRTAIILDPMLATGGSSIAAIELLQQRGCKRIKMVNLVGAPDGVEAVQKAHPEVPIYLATLDDKLNNAKYIVPGLGDAGDRLFGTP